MVMTAPARDPALDTHQHLSASALLRRLVDRATGPQVTIGEMIEAFGERAFGLVMILFCLPNMVPLPGIGALFGIPLLLAAIQMAMGARRPWMPAALNDRAMATSTLKRLVDAVEPKLLKVENLLKPRMPGLFSPFMDRAVGVFAALCALSIIIPFPGTNFLPAVGVILISLAVMQEDGICLLVGGAIGLAGLIYTTTVLVGLAWGATVGLERLLGG